MNSYSPPVFTQYEDYLRDVYVNGREKTDRTGTGTKAVFGRQMRWDLAHGFPLVTTKKVHLKSIVHELLWFLMGSTDNNLLKEMGCSIWDEWAREDGDLGPIYGKQWRSWGGKLDVHNEPPPADVTSWHVIQATANTDAKYVYQTPIDQMQVLLDTLRKSPDSRRMIVNAWNVADLPDMALTPCHCLFQFYTEVLTLVERNKTFCGTLDLNAFVDYICSHEEFDKMGVPKYRLSCQLYQRSCDSFLGVPFNIASYALLTHMVAQQVNMVAGDFIWTGGDCHIYKNHYEQVELQLGRPPFRQPQLCLRKAKDLFSYQLDDIVFSNYQCYPAIKGQVAV